ncbi:MAG: DNA-processing protein DprA [bacterium]|nr:DNA-processing protein DprA [bacterium]
MSEHETEIRESCQQKGIQILSPGRDSYPFLLTEISSPPAHLFVKGSLEVLSSRTLIAVVGTRKISPYGTQVLHEIIPSLVRSGAVIVSGLAFGVDSLAHRIALEHGGKCIAVFGCGVERVYPPEHRSLAQKIVELGGALVSEYPPGTPPLKQFFPARNRIISGLSKATIVVEAQIKSGSLITAQFALDQNREVFAVPGSIFGDTQQGTNHLITEGAYPLVSTEKLLEQLNLTGAGTCPDPDPLIFASSEEELIYQSLRESRSLDELSVETHMAPSMLNQMVTMMELKGLVRNLGNMRYVRS